jgi:hypothetical protein
MLLWFGFRKRSVHLDAKLFWLGLMVRVFGGLSFAVIYLLWIKEGDTIAFFYKATDLADLALNFPNKYFDFLISSQHDLYKSEGRDGFFIKILSVFALATNNNYWLTTVYFSILSFFPIWYLINVIYLKFPNHKWSLIAAFLILPSPIFWTSGILKDCLVFTSLALIMTGLFKIHFDQKLKWYDVVGLIISLILLFKLRYFLFGLTSAGLIAITMNRFIFSKIDRLISTMAIWVLIIIICVSGISLINPNLYPSNFPKALYDNYVTILNHSEAGNTLEFNLQPHWWSLIVHVPESLFSGLYRPFLGEASSYHLIHGLENLGLIILSIFSMIYLKKSPHPNALFLIGLLFILILATFFPLASPNFGSLMRYKAIYLPLLFYFVSIVPLSIWFPIDDIKG